jgi:hypothetical protein
LNQPATRRIAIAPASHHLLRSQHYLNLVPANIANGDYLRAADALRRAASHAVTAAAIHWSIPHKSRRRLHTVLAMLMFDGKLGYTHQRTFRQVYVLDDRIADASPAFARRILFRERRRVSELLSAIRTAMLQQPNPPTWEDIIQSLSTPIGSGIG